MTHKFIYNDKYGQRAVEDLTAEQYDADYRAVREFEALEAEIARGSRCPNSTAPKSTAFVRDLRTAIAARRALAQRAAAAWYRIVIYGAFCRGACLGRVMEGRHVWVDTDGGGHAR